MKKYILRLIDDKIKTLEAISIGLTKRKESGQYPLADFDKLIEKNNKKLLEAKKYKEKFLKLNAAP